MSLIKPYITIHSIIDKLMKQIIYLLLIFVLFSVVSCAADEECRKNKTVAMIVGFHKNTLNTTTNLYTTSTLTVDSLTVQGIDSN